MIKNTKFTFSLNCHFTILIKYRAYKSNTKVKNSIFLVRMGLKSQNKSQFGFKLIYFQQAQYGKQFEPFIPSTLLMKPTPMGLYTHPTTIKCIATHMWYSELRSKQRFSNWTLLSNGAIVCSSGFVL